MHQYVASQFSLSDLVSKKASSLAVVIPALDEEETLPGVLGHCVELADAGLVDEILVADSGSTDGTALVAEAMGVNVVRCIRDGGKGRAMFEGLAASSSDLVCWVDADVSDFGKRFVLGLAGPLLTNPEVDFVKAKYRRPISLGGKTYPLGGGRVTELTARPLLKLLAPEISVISQPLAGECAGRRDLMARTRFAEGYGVDVGLVFEVAKLAGIERIAEVDLGVRHHRNRPLAELAPMADQVARTIVDMCGTGDQIRYFGPLTSGRPRLVV